MADFSNKLEQIKPLFSSNSKPNKSFAYSSLLHLQEHSDSDPSCMQTLSHSSENILKSIISDISNESDEEVAALALKCLGFMVYHPVLVAAITVDDAIPIIASLTKLIKSTKIKSVCNLGVWCISIQQFDASVLAVHFQSLLIAVVHALDNPMGSLSTTFEAIQAVMKLETQMSANMRDTSNVWAPPIYRRLLSNDKREKDISERCLFKIRSTIIPSPSNLSKVIVLDMKNYLLSRMKELLQHGMKVQTLQAWGWFIRLLGSHAMNNKALFNEMLKFPERAFSDHDPQVQTAALVAWEGVIDALLHPLTLDRDMVDDVQQNGSSKEKCNGIHRDKSLKIINLIMTPLIGIMSSKCEVSVHSACLNTWCYLLHKLDSSVIDPSVIKTVLEPIFEAVFKTKFNNRSILSWKFCVALLGDFISIKSKNIEYDSNNQTINCLSDKATITGAFPWKNDIIKWMSWDLIHLNIHMKMINIIIGQGATTLSSEYRNLAFDAAFNLFRSVLKGIQHELKRSTVTYDHTILCLSVLLKYVKKICEDVTSKNSENMGFNTLRFIEAVTEELELSILGSPLYKIALDFKYIENVESVKDTSLVKLQAISSITYMDLVSPLVYLTILYFSVVAQWTVGEIKMQKYLQRVLSTYDSCESLFAVISLLFKHIQFSYFKIWITISEVTKDYIDSGKGVSRFGYLQLCHLLSYPLIVYSYSQKELPQMQISASPELSLVSALREIEFQHVIGMWTSLYDSVIRASKFDCLTVYIFTENLCLMLNDCIDEITSIHECDMELGSRYKSWNCDLLTLAGEVVICVMEHISSSEVRTKEYTYNEAGAGKGFSAAVAIVRLASRFLGLSWTKNKPDPSPIHPLNSRVLSALTRFVGCLHLKQDIQSFNELLSGSLLQQLSYMEARDENVLPQLQLLWTETLNSLLRSQPPISFDSSFLKLQAPLLEKTLLHPNPAISKPTINFWNSTYGRQLLKLDYPQNLLHVIDKVSRTRKINLGIRYRVNATNNKGSKRVELVKDMVTDYDQGNYLLSRKMKRKGVELTEHQKEVRRAQQGRVRDCSGHGPGVRTYTTVDFSQVNDESQDSEDV